MPHKGPQRIPTIAVLINIRHAAPQARLQVLRVVPEQQHDEPPRERRKRRPGVVADARAQRLGRHDREARAGLDGQARQAEDHAREDVDDDLLVHGRDLARARGAPAKDEVAAEEAGEKGVVGAWRGGVGD